MTGRYRLTVREQHDQDGAVVYEVFLDGEVFVLTHSRDLLRKLERLAPMRWTAEEAV